MLYSFIYILSKKAGLLSSKAKALETELLNNLSKNVFLLGVIKIICGLTSEITLLTTSGTESNSISSLLMDSAMVFTC